MITINVSGFLYLYNPDLLLMSNNLYQESSTHESDYNLHEFCHGYGKLHLQLHGVRFQMNSGAIDSGKIKLYGIKE